MAVFRAFQRTAHLRASLRKVHSPVRSFQRLSSTTSHEFLRIHDEVRDALNTGKPVVALETTIYTHGFPYPDNVALASHLESVVRVNGGVPATIGIIDGIARVGMDAEELIKLASSAGNENTLKLSRRDLGFVCGMRLTGKKFNGGTTIAGTMILAELAGIQVFATGGLGGVHRGAESSMDISADLTELGRTPVAVVSSGCKSFLDIPRTLEYLETEGVGVSTFADGRPGKVDFPAFWSRDSGVRSPTVVQNEIEAAAIIYAQNSLSIKSGLLFANPIPEEYSIPKPEMDLIITEAIKEATAAGASGKDNTPFILSKIKELSGSKSITANRALIESNVRRGTIVARELAVMQAQGRRAETGSTNIYLSSRSPNTSSTSSQLSEATQPTIPSQPSKLDYAAIVEGSSPEVVVAGALAVDFSCDFAPFKETSPELALSPQLHTSNPSRITQTLGGVGHNVAKALHYLGANVSLYSAVGDDLSGRAALAQLQLESLRTDGIKTLPDPSIHRTAQYVAVNDANKDLMLAMADMSILESISSEQTETLWPASLHNGPTKPRCLVVDGNWSQPAAHAWLRAGKTANAITAFEPVSTAKASRFIASSAATPSALPVFPNHIVDITTPNQHELAAFHSTAQSGGLFESADWWRVIDALGISSAGLRVALAVTTSSALVDEGIPQRSIQLLPFIPTILTKLGPKGVLLTMLLPAGDERLHDPVAAQYVLARSKIEGSGVGGVYVRLFEPPEVLEAKDVVSVNGVGDTFLGAVVAGLLKDRKIDQAIEVAQRAAGLSLRSKEAVSPELATLKGLV